MSTIKSSAENLTLNADGANNDIKFQSNGVEKASIDQDGKLTALALAVDNITIDGTEIDLSSGDLTVDVAGDILLDAGGADIRMMSGGTDYCKFTKSGDNTIIKAQVSDGDLVLRGSDGGSQIDALTFDMSDAGVAKFNRGILFNNDTAAANELDDYEEGSFTVTMAAQGGGTFTLNGDQNLLYYTKVGRLVSIGGRIKLDSISSPSGEVTIVGLPFAANGVGEGSNKSYIGVHFRDAAAEVGAVSGQTATSSIAIYEAGTTGNTNVADKIDGGTYIMIGGVYMTS